eukprot:201159-Amorphochlora_amoeboformis.AAC.1
MSVGIMNDRRPIRYPWVLQLDYVTWRGVTQYQVTNGYHPLLPNVTIFKNLRNLQRSPVRTTMFQHVITVSSHDI